MATPADIPPNPGSCWACGYSLRGLGDDTRRCPDCGRPFDPGDPKSVNRGRPVGAIGKRALVPPGWPTVALAALAVLLVLGGTGGVTGFHAQFDDWRLLAQSFTRAEPWGRLSFHWRLYAAGVILAVAVAAWAVARLMLRSAFLARHRPPADFYRGRNGIAAGVAMLLAVSFTWVACGGALRVGREWAEVALRLQQPANRAAGYAIVDPPVTLSDSQKREAIRAVMIGGGSPRHRRAALALHCLNAGIDDPAVLREAVAREHDSEVAAIELRLLGMYRDTAQLELVASYLDDPRPPVRAAAADAVGMIHSPAYPVGIDRNEWGVPVPSVAGNPPAELSGLLIRDGTFGWRDSDGDGIADDPVRYPFYTLHHSMPPERRARLSRMMLEAPTLEEREAAARALLPQPPENYRLRFAEWGVWLNENGDLTMAKSVAAEIPPFVHRTGNPIAEMAPRTQQRFIVTKPVIHLTVSEPMAVDVEVRIRRGRPWFAYPTPDDFEVAGGGSVPFAPRNTGPATQPVPYLAKLDPPAGFGTLPPSQLRSGYPWTDPPHRKIPLTEIEEMGVHWQSVIVTPTKQPWMAEPTVGADPKHAWWRRLRDVECSWVSSRGESERFLYYDGPTQLKMPFTFRWDGTAVRWSPLPPVPHEETLGDVWPGVSSEAKPSPRWLAIPVRVGKDGSVARPEFTREDGAPLDDFNVPHVDRADRFVGNGVTSPETILRETLFIHGLTESESQGLLDTWREAFFKKPGVRLLLVMPQLAYQQFCPLVVRPEPTERVRVGIVVTELTQNGK